MKRSTITTGILGVLVLLAGQAFAATPVRLLRPAPGDLFSTRLVPAAQAPAPTANTSHDPVTFSWPLEASRPLSLENRPFTKRSREYWRKVTASELERGVFIDVVTPGAIIRINPVAGSAPAGARALRPSELEIISGSHGRMDVSSAAATIAQEADLARADIRFPEGTLALRLKPELGTGRFQLRAPGIQAAAAARYLVSVLEPRSPVVLAVTTSSQTLLPGMTLRSSIALKDAGRPIPIDSARGWLVAPDGRTSGVRVSRSGDGRLAAVVPLDRIEPGAAGMWELKVSVTGTLDGETVHRDLRTAFAYALPTARLTGEAVVTLPGTAGSGLAVSLPVETAVAGRYEVRGILYGTGADGRLAPMGVADTAAWLPNGVNDLELRFPASIVNRTGFRPPYEIRDLRLMDQSRMAVLLRQRRGLVIGRSPGGLRHPKPTGGAE